MPFTWTDPDDDTVTITLPEAAEIPAGVWRKVRRLADLDAVFTLIEAVADEPTLAAVDALPTGRLNGLFSAWVGGAGMGESAGSST